MDHQQCLLGNEKKLLLGQSSNSGNNTTNENNTNSVGSKDKMVPLPGENTKGQVNTSPTNEANPSASEPSKFDAKTFFSFSESSSSDEYDTDSSFDESVFPNEAAKVEAMKQRLAMYEEMLARRQAEDEKAKTSTKDPAYEEVKHLGKRNIEDSSEETQQKQLCRCHNVLERSFQRAMDEGNIRGFVYGIFLKDGSVLQGSSMNLCKWWEEEIRDYQNGNFIATEQPINPTEQGVMPEAPMDRSPKPKQSLAFTCDNPLCLPSHANYGLGTAELQDQHKQICVNPNSDSEAQFSAPYQRKDPEQSSPDYSPGEPSHSLIKKEEPLAE